MTIKQFLESLDTDEDRLRLLKKNPQEACDEAGLTERQCAALLSGNLGRIRAIIEFESGPTRGLVLRVVM